MTSFLEIDYIKNMKLLILRGKFGDTYFDASTEDKKNEAYELIFDICNNDKYYIDGEFSPERKELLLKALDGDKVAKRSIVKWRSFNRYEYEIISEESTYN